MVWLALLLSCGLDGRECEVIDVDDEGPCMANERCCYDLGGKDQRCDLFIFEGTRYFAVSHPNWREGRTLADLQDAICPDDT